MANSAVLAMPSSDHCDYRFSLLVVLISRCTHQFSHNFSLFFFHLQLRSTKMNEKTHYEIVGEGVVGHNPPIFTVNDNGDLFVTSQLDREQKSKYLLRAKLLDERSNLVEREEDFVVLVTDINDNDPVFPPSFNASITERSHRGN